MARAPQGIRDPEDNNLEGKAVSNVYRKHPLSIAISMALLAAAATSAMASEERHGGARLCATGRTDDTLARRQESQVRGAG